MARTMYQRAAILIERAQAKAARLGAEFSRVAQVYDRRAGESEASETPIVVCNWNRVDRYDHATGRRIELEGGRLFEKLEAMLRHVGCETEWPDNGTSCDDCSGWVETQPSHMMWRPQFHMFDGSIVCRGCIQKRPSDYIDAVSDSDEICTLLDSDDLEAFGYESIASAESWTSERTKAIRSILASIPAERRTGAVIVSNDESYRETLTVWAPSDF